MVHIVIPVCYTTCKCTQVRRFIKQGIPDDMRGQVWNKMIGSQAIKAISSFDYQVNDNIVLITFFISISSDKIINNQKLLHNSCISILNRYTDLVEAWYFHQVSFIFKLLLIKLLPFSCEDHLITCDSTLCLLQVQRF